MRATAGPNGKWLLSVTGALEATTGLGLLVAPSVVVELLLGAAPDTTAVTVSRVAGVALLALGVACWLARDEAACRAAKALAAALLLYNIGVVVVLAFAWASPTPVGIAFWPVVLAHTGLAVWCVSSLPTRAFKEKRS